MSRPADPAEYRAELAALEAMVEGALARQLAALGLPDVADVAATAAAVAEAGEEAFRDAGPTMMRIRHALGFLAACEAARREWEASQPTPQPATGPDGAAIFVIEPYPWGGGWVFDDPARDLWREPLRMGMERILDRASGAGRPEARDRFRLTFSARPFPGATERLVRTGGVLGGVWYTAGDAAGWLCPALFRYFDREPEEIHWRRDAPG